MRNRPSGRLMMYMISSLIIALFPVASYAADTGEAAWLQQMMEVMPKAVRDASTVIVHCQTPSRISLDKNEQGLVPEKDPNYGSAMTGLTLAKLNVLAKVRGEADSIIFVQHLVGMMEKLHYCPFTAQKGAEWVLFLENPLAGQTTADAKLKSRFNELHAETFLNAKNFFRIKSSGFAAVCVKWPETAAKPKNLTVWPHFVEDLTKIVAWQKTATQGGKQPLSDELAKSLQETLSKRLAEKL